MANEIEKLKVELLDPELVALADKIVQVIEEGKQALAISINEIIKTTYWRIGQYIVEFEQQGNAKAKYGTSLLSNLAKLLRAKVGRGYSRPNLNNMRKFYLMYPICQTSDKSSPIFQTADSSNKLAAQHVHVGRQRLRVPGTPTADGIMAVSDYQTMTSTRDGNIELAGLLTQTGLL